jgi:hypothetical protein
MLQQLQLAICPLGEHRRAERLHNLFNGNILVGELVSRRAIWRGRGNSQLAWMHPSQAKTQIKNGVEGNSPDKTKRSHAHRLEV